MNICISVTLVIASKLRQKWRQKVEKLPVPERLAAFTLIELSIVLVIIGLIVGGVMVGQDLINAAKIRSDISQIAHIETAARTFKLKYNCMPGDCKNAVSLGLGTNASWHNGNNDKKIDIQNGVKCFYSFNNLSKDANNFFLHLNQAGLFAGQYEGYTGNAHNSCYSKAIMEARFPSSATQNGFFIPAWLNGYGNSLAIAGADFNGQQGLLKDDARIIDEKIDDGVPITGHIMLDAVGGSNAFALQPQTVDVIVHSCVRRTYQLTGCSKVNVLFIDKF